ncbi:hypothetical protein DICVIV_00480 [Dictyocaulus viviparus]|uniref:Uncharacterized protein n=1 Tax=Dictyocaulus viviparus TaxID=29172 RepID=A0A0D8YAY0_DICVI|nr:hypothetical protein DICVIV_00480 [Dictyocaulus viviparus]
MDQNNLMGNFEICMARTSSSDFSRSMYFQLHRRTVLVTNVHWLLCGCNQNDSELFAFRQIDNKPREIQHMYTS